MSYTPDAGYVLIGKLGKTFQLEGGLRFYGLSEAEIAAIYELDTVFIPGLDKLNIKQVRSVGSSVVLYLAGINHLAAAKALVNKEVYARAKDLPELNPGNYYLDTLLKLPVIGEAGNLGTVTDVIKAGSQDLLVVSGEQEYLLPLQADYIRIEAAAIYVENAPEDLFELHKPA